MLVDDLRLCGRGGSACGSIFQIDNNVSQTGIGASAEDAAFEGLSLGIRPAEAVGDGQFFFRGRRALESNFTGDIRSREELH